MMKPRKNLLEWCVALKPGLRLAPALLLFPFASTFLPAQQPYPYGSYANPYLGQYASPGPQYAPQQYAQPQYSQPQYPQQQYAQPQSSQPQYAQPQYPQQPYAEPAQPYPQQDLSQPEGAPAQPLDAAELEQLVAPIALYPDALLAQILAASTYPAQTAVADQWLNGMRAQGYGSPDQIAAGADEQSNWDPSVKALTAFPQVLDMLNHNLEWTTNLGNAYYNQPQDVMQTVQVLRERAQQAGNLDSTPQEEVSNDQGYIELAPADPQVVYVPAYNPWDVYGQPVSPYPGFSLLGTLGSVLGGRFGGGPIQFGLGIAMAAFEHTPFGWLGWGLNWLTNSILFNHSDYNSQSTTVADWGFPHGGPRGFGRGVAAGGYRGTQGYMRPGNSYDRGESYLRPADRFAGEQRGNNGYARGYQGPVSGPGRGPGNNGVRPALPAQQAYNRMPPASVRPQGYAGRPQAYAGGVETRGNPGYGYGNQSRPGQSYAARPGGGYASAYQSYRAPSYGAQSYREPSYRAPEARSSRGFSGRSNDAYGESYARNEHSGGFHLFGHGHESNGFNGGRAPKNSYGGGHAPKGFGHEKAPKASHSGGGHKHFR
jgi:hypothetical protein